MNRTVILNKVKVYFLSLFISTIILLCISCNDTPTGFTMVMYGKYDDNARVNMTVTLPNSGRVRDITFTVNSVVYTTSSSLSTASPKFFFDDVKDDGMKTVRLELSDSIDGNAELYMVTTDGEEKIYYSSMSDFTPLLNYLRAN